MHGILTDVRRGQCPTRGCLHTARPALLLGCVQGKAPGLLGWWPGKAVTFIDNHDTGSTQNHWPFPGWGVGQGHAYILTHPGG